MINFKAILSFVIKATKTLFERFLNVVTRWLKKLPDLIKDSIIGELIGCMVYVNTKEGETISKNYSKKNDQWYETTASQTVSMDEIPEEIRRKSAESDVVEITDELEMFLG